MKHYIGTDIIFSPLLKQLYHDHLNDQKFCSKKEKNLNNDEFI